MYPEAPRQPTGCPVPTKARSAWAPAPRRGQPAPGQRGRKLGSPPALWGSQSQGHVIRPWEPAEVVRAWPTHPFDDDALRTWRNRFERRSVGRRPRTMHSGPSSWRAERADSGSVSLCIVRGRRQELACSKESSIIAPAHIRPPGPLVDMFAPD